MSASKLILWSPRILGILMALFLGLFSLDAVAEGAGAVLIHSVPSLVLLLAVILAWRRPWVGALVFFASAALYCVFAWGRADWIATIAGPLTAVGALFLLSWRRNPEIRAEA